MIEKNEEAENAYHRETALKLAVELCKAPGTIFTDDKVLHTAEKFKRYLGTGELP